ncbi:MAG: acetylxylan esterase AxeA1 [Prevotella sp.]|jgi:acetyl esterase/lipase
MKISNYILSQLIFLSYLLFFDTTADAQTSRRFTLVNSEDGASKIEAFLPESPSGRAVVDLPGGGYSHLAINHEGYDWADYFNRQGIAYFVLTYRMPNGDRNIPLSDAYRAIRTVRDSALSWHVNPYDVGIMGFSAGGHLASAVSTHAPWDARPNFSILFYPVISMNERDSHKGSVLGFLGEGRHDQKLVNEWTSSKAVRGHLTPPAIVILANDDRVVPPVTNGIAYYAAMRQEGNNCALMVYPTGGHGFGFRPSFTYHQQMLQELTSWLDNLKAPNPKAVRVACIGNSITDGMGIDMRDAYSYPAYLQNMLGDNYVVKNFGVSARTLLNKGNLPYMKETAWKDARNFQPDIAIIMLGTNDTKPENWQYGKDFESNLNAMIDSLQSLTSHPRILLGAPITVLRTPTSTKWGIRDSILVNNIIPVIRKVASKRHLQFINLHSLFPSASEGMMQNDGVHPTEKGAKALAGIIQKEIIRKH